MSLRRSRLQDADLYALLDTYAAFVPALLQPKNHRSQGTTPLSPISHTRMMQHWAASLPHYTAPAHLPGLYVEPPELESCVPRLTWLALSIGAGMAPEDSRDTARELAQVDETLGALVAAGLGRIVASNHLRTERRRSKWSDANAKPAALIGPEDTPLLDPSIYPALEQVHALVTRLGHMPVALLGFLKHGVQSACADAVQRLSTGAPLSAWEDAWARTLAILLSMTSKLRPGRWELISKSIVRPLCHLATMDDLSDATTAMVFRGFVALYDTWSSAERHGGGQPSCAAALEKELFDLEEAVLMDGTPALGVYDASFAFHEALAKHGSDRAPSSLYPFPFFAYACSPIVSGSLVSLDRVCGLVCALLGDENRFPGALETMTVALVEMIWSGRAFASLQQNGLVIDSQQACDGCVCAAALLTTARHLLPSGRPAMTSAAFHLRSSRRRRTAPRSRRCLSAISMCVLLACGGAHAQEVLLTQASAARPFVRAPITPSALRPARQVSERRRTKLTPVWAAAASAVH